MDCHCNGSVQKDFSPIISDTAVNESQSISNSNPTGNLVDTNTVCAKDESCSSKSETFVVETSSLEQPSSAAVNGNSLVTPLHALTVDKCSSDQSANLKLSLSLNNEFLPVDSDSFSPQTPCSRFESCTLDGFGHCAGIAGASLCRWDNIVGPCVVYVWATSAKCRSWLATCKKLTYISRCTLGGEITRTPRGEAKFFASSDSDMALVTVVFSAYCSDLHSSSVCDTAVHSMSIIIPYSQLPGFVSIKNICLEWLCRTAQHLRILLSEDVIEGCDWFHRMFVDFLHVVDCLDEQMVPRSISLSDTVFHPGHSFNSKFVQKAIAAHLYQCQQTVIVGQSVNDINLMVETLSMFTLSTLRHRCCCLSESNVVCNYCPELCLQGLLKESDWEQQRLTLADSVYCSQYPTALVDISSCEVWILCAPYDYTVNRHKYTSSQLLKLWSHSADSQQAASSHRAFKKFDISTSMIVSCINQLDLLPASDGVREAFIHTFMTSLQRQALAVINFVAMQTNRGRCAVDLSKVRRLFSLSTEGDLMTVLCVAERLKPTFLDFVCQSLRTS